MEFSDQELVNEIRAGSSVSFGHLMDRYRRLVYRVAYGFTRDRESAMDIAQDTFLEVHSGLAGWRGEGSLKNWIARIAAHKAMNQERSRRRRPTQALEGEEIFLRPDPPQETQLSDRETRRALHRSLRALSPRQQLAVVLRYYEGMSAREISGVLECTEGTARNILFRSLQKLRTTLSAEEMLP